MKKLGMILPLALILFVMVSCQKGKEVTEEVEPITHVKTEVDLKAEEETIRKLFYNEILAAYKRRDSKAMADLADETYMVFGRVIRGRAAIEGLFANFFKSIGEAQLNPLEEIGMVFVTPEVSIFQVRSEITNRTDADGNPLSPQQIYGVNLYVKRNGRWLRATSFILPISD